MHNKFLLASHTLSADGCVARDSSFVTTANVDYFKASGVQNHHDWYQSGVLVKENKNLREALRRSTRAAPRGGHRSFFNTDVRSILILGL